jgi:hypothetical protein
LKIFYWDAYPEDQNISEAVNHGGLYQWIHGFALNKNNQKELVFRSKIVFS